MDDHSTLLGTLCRHYAGAKPARSQPRRAHTRAAAAQRWVASYSACRALAGRLARSGACRGVAPSPHSCALTRWRCACALPLCARALQLRSWLSCSAARSSWACLRCAKSTPGSRPSAQCECCGEQLRKRWRVDGQRSGDARWRWRCELLPASSERGSRRCHISSPASFVSQYHRSSAGRPHARSAAMRMPRPCGTRLSAAVASRTHADSSMRRHRCCAGARGAHRARCGCDAARTVILTRSCASSCDVAAAERRRWRDGLLALPGSHMRALRAL